ncbi:hypothetical protein O6H91_13G079200 [Diphasiastrum complanatum]|nr:hypothetical protein O6H91_13G079200 [Diphasiastrum complanatum]
MVDSGPTKYFAWDSCKERYALLETVPAPKILPVVKSGSSRKAREAAAQAAAVAAAAAANAAASATVEIRILLEDGSSNLLTKSIEGRTEQVIGLQGGALLGVAYKMPRGSSSSSTFSMDDGSSFLGSKSAGDAQANFQIYSWESFKPVSGMLPQPEWSAWDQTVEYCAFAYQRYIVIASLRPQYRYLGNVAIGYATGGVWHRRQLFLATPTSIECVFVDAGVSPIDVERKKRKEEEKVNQVQAKAIAEQGELALLTVNAPHAINEERVALRPPMLQVVRLASFQTTPSVPLFLPTRQSKADGDNGGPQKDVMERKVNDNAVAGGGVQVAVSRLPLEQKRPVGPLLVVGVRDGVLWLVDRYMTAHAIGLSHPGIRCRCLAAYGDAVSAVKWASRLGREHHDDLAQFMLGMGYATEALHLPGISKRLEYELAMQSGDLKRAFQCLTTLSNSKSIGQEIDLTSDVTGILALTTKEKKLDAVQGIANFSAEFIKLVDAADATGQTEIAGEALKKLAAAGAVVGALQPRELKGLALRLATHGELTRLAVQVNTMISAGHGREAALAAALLGDPSLLEKAWQDTNMFPEAALHAHAHGRPTLKALLEQWNSTLQKDYGIKSKKLSTSSPESSILSPQRSSIMQNLSEPVKRAVIEVVPPGLIKASSTTPLISTPVNQKVAGKQEPSQSSQLLLIEAAPLVSV